MKNPLIYLVIVFVAIIFASCESKMITEGGEHSLTYLADSLHPDSTYVSDTVKITPDSAHVPVPIDSIGIVATDTTGTHNLYVDITGDEFTFIPSIVDSLSSSGLLIRILSTKPYQCLNSHLNYTTFATNVNERNFRMSIYNITQPGAKYCEQGEERVSGFTSLYPLAEGSSNLEVTVNGTTYKGSVTKTNNSYVIDWPNTNGIKFSQLTLTK